MSEQLKNIKFVQEIEKNPCLYDYWHMHYARRDITEKAWCDVGKKCNLAGPQCKEKWKNFRTVLARNLKPPNGSSKRRKKPYYLAEAMKFAIPFIKTHNSVSQSSQSNEQESIAEEDHEDKEEDIELIIYPKNSPPSSYSPSPSPQISPSAPYSPETCLISIPSPQLSLSPERNSLLGFKSARISNNMNDLDTFKLDTNDTKEPKQLTSSDNAINISRKMFLLSLLPDVYSMTDVQMRSFRIKVLTLIDEIAQT